jgi:hypothetical protein
MSKIRAELQSNEQYLQKVIKKVGLDYKYSNEDYDDIKKVINFIKINVSSLQADSLENVIFLLGATGAGKSTLVNYLNYGDSNFVVADDQGTLKIKKDSIVEVGTGNGSTTLFPNVWKSSLGTFLDCAGEGDTSGILAEIINSFVKMRIASNINNAKIVFVAKSSSLDHNGGYGKTFKDALDKNAQFLSNIDYFQNSTGLVITGAGVKKSALENAIISIEKIIEHHKNIDTYKNILYATIHNKNITTFSRASDSIEMGEDYVSPVWNPNQQKVISDMIGNIPFSKIPTKDFFNTSSTSETRETMIKALYVLKLKAGNIINDFIENSLPFSIFAVELKPFAKYINGLMVGHKNELITYCKILEYNNYLKKHINSEILLKVNEDINFVSQFINKDSKEKIDFKEDWGDIAKVKSVFKNVFEDLQDILLEQGQNFLKSVSKSNVILKTSKYAISVLEHCEKLYNEYKNVDEIERLGKDKESKYYKDIEKKEFLYTTKDINSTNKKSDIIVETFNEKETYHSTEEYSEYETRYKPVTKYKTEPYQEPITKYRTEYYQAPVTKYRTEYYDDTESAPVRNAFKQIFTLGMGDTARDHVRKSREVSYIDYEQKSKEVPYIDYVQKSREVPYTDQESYQEKVTKFRPVIKERDIVKANVFSKYFIKELDKEKYNNDFNKSNEEIGKIRKTVLDIIGKYSKGKMGIHSKDDVVSKDKFEDKYIDLLKKVQEAEYENYFAENPNNSLEELSIDIIGEVVSN